MAQVERDAVVAGIEIVPGEEVADQGRWCAGGR
jgi:hypothetical protein